MAEMFSEALKEFRALLTDPILPALILAVVCLASLALLLVDENLATIALAIGCVTVVVERAHRRRQ
ncbi:MAG TPA: hypothetical protein VHD15_03765 [Hyphomicrobiales bacterium]|nr:hypothetical protein [Hyphomicrobiales bacterium]